MNEIGGEPVSNNSGSEDPQLMDRLADEGTDTALNVMTKYLAQHEHKRA